jgi:NAD(P)-dependent dehydrogenase (short-subunit alcohol dehydrogenase family)
MRLAGKRVLVTGGSRSIGRAIAVGLGAEGAAVGVNYRASEKEANEVVAQIREKGGTAAALYADVAKKAAVDAMVAKFVETFGGIDLLVCNAGVLKRTPFLEISEEEWDWIQSINLKGYFLAGQAVAKQMVKQGGGGAMCMISSAGAKLAAPNLAHYNTAKAGITMLVQEMALELAPHKIRVNAIGPGLLETDLNRKDIQNPEFYNFRIARIPLKIIGVPEDVVGAVAYLLSDDARLVTGTTLYMDAGQSIW